MKHECEVYNLFAAHVCQSGDINGPTRQALVPDFMVTTRTQHRELLDVKCITYCASRYKKAHSEVSQRPVQVRQRAVHREYRQKAREADRNYNGTSRGTIGPVERELGIYGEVKGLVVGAYGEASSHVEELVQQIAKGIAKHRWREMGASDYIDARAAVLARTRRWVGIEAVRGHAALKVARKRELTSGNCEDAKRRRSVSKRMYILRRLEYFQYHCGYGVRSDPRIW